MLPWKNENLTNSGLPSFAHQKDEGSAQFIVVMWTEHFTIKVEKWEKIIKNIQSQICSMRGIATVVVSITLHFQ